MNYVELIVAYYVELIYQMQTVYDTRLLETAVPFCLK